MGIFDRFRRKEQPSKRRSYAGVNTSRLFADFSTMTRSSDSELKPALRVLRNRCRELSRNDEYVRRYLGLLKTNVVGPYGVNVQAKARNADGSLDAPGNKIVENAWKVWGSAKTAPLMADYPGSMPSGCLLKPSPETVRLLYVLLTVSII